jgi:hypothetical protein
MDTKAILAANARDPRLDLFLGIANWCIFLDHIPYNAVNRLTIRNFGFSGAADAFIFIAGYGAAAVFGKMMLERGFIVGATRVFKRFWQLYIAYVLLFVIYIVTVADVASRYGVPDIIYEFNVAGLVDSPIRTLGHGLLLQSKPLNLDILQLYTLLMALFAPVLWIMLRRPNLVMAASVVLYFAARQHEWRLPSFPDGDQYFNPFCWQMLFLAGAWTALGVARQSRAIPGMPMLRYLGIAYLVFALVMTLAGRFPELERIFPAWLFDAFNPNDRSTLAPYRFLHFIVLAFFVTRLVPKDWHGLDWPIFSPLVKCGQQSVAVFCIGVFLSFAGHFVLILGSDSLLEQIFVSAAGIAIMTLVAYYISWSKRQDSPGRVAPAPAPRAQIPVEIEPRGEPERQKALV